MRTPEEIYKEWAAADRFAEYDAENDEEFAWWSRYAGALQWALGDDFKRLNTPPWVPPTDKLEQLAEWVRIGQSEGNPNDQLKWWANHPLQRLAYGGDIGGEGYNLVRVLEWLKS